MIQSFDPTSPIGVFDSGVGGISVWKELISTMPNEDIIYIADNANCPYGSKSQDEIIQLSSRITDFLLAQKCKLIVVACNTATAAAISHLREHYPHISFVGMEPAVKPAALNSKTGVVGILATAGTLKGRLFNETKQRFASSVTVIEQVGEGLVEAVENGTQASQQTQQLLRSYIQPMLDAGIDHLVLGCTHYPFLIPQIEEIAGEKVTIIDPAPAVAKQAKLLLITGGLAAQQEINEPVYTFYATGRTDTLQAMLDGLSISKQLVSKLSL